jgi:aldehyde:ferredoxin oxidoreductase
LTKGYIFWYKLGIPYEDKRMFGWTGKILRVNLDKKSIFEEELKPELNLDVLGGRGLAVKLFTAEVKPEVDSLSTENKIVLMTGPLTGTGASSASLCAIVTKSALTQTIVSAEAKLHFGAELKAAGYDGLIIEGKANEPVILKIQDGRANILPADYLVGQDTKNTIALLHSTFNDPWVAREVKILCIGPAGEKQLPIASLITEGFLVSDSVGIGAVFGSKNLKAVAVRGTKDILLNDGQELIRVISKNVKECVESKALNAFSLFGSYYTYEEFLNKNILPSFYFTRPYVLNVPLRQIRTYWKRKKACFSCPVACLKADQQGAFFPELEAFIALGPLCGIDEVSLIVEAYQACLKSGLDPVETGVFIASLMKITEKGLLEEKELPINIQFGNKKAYSNLIPLLEQPEKLFSLAKDTASLWEKVGEPEEFIGIKRRSIALDVSYFSFLALYAVTSNWPTLHPHVYRFTNIHKEDIPKEVKNVQDISAALECLGVCPYLYIGLSLKAFLSIVKAVVGLEWKEENLLKVGEHTIDLEHDFNQKAGITLEADHLPRKLKIIEFEKMLKLYYQLRGWQ